jgi:hypothetical protein
MQRRSGEAEGSRPLRSGLSLAVTHCATLGKVSDPSREVRMRPSHRAAVRSPDQGLGHACSRPSRPPPPISAPTSQLSPFVVNFSFLLSRYNKRAHKWHKSQVCSLMNFYISRYQYNHPRTRNKYFQALLRFLCDASQSMSSSHLE